ncbi:hypothetical protein ACIRRT_33710 [Streptomyces sp. NPDC102256]|uniref:hypothetical protein n=1 Tax=Streptomyces sp. NPDC102256 TaxID=3366147 RepID=UPI0037F87823
MHGYLVGLAVAAVTGGAGLGVAAIAASWVPPLVRRRVVRPRLWGWGALSGSLGMSLFMLLGPFHGPDADMTPYAMTGMALFLVGQALQMLGQYPGRVAKSPHTDLN